MIHDRLRILIPAFALLLLTACASTPSAPQAAQHQAVDLQAAMTSAQFKAAGLDKLNPEELQNLDGWLTNNSGVVTPKVSAQQGKKDFGLPPKKEPEPKSITAHIVGHFDGWDGKTVFKLDNGQVWQQAGFGHFTHHAENPEVHIWKGWFGYLMRVEGYNATVAVRRIK